MSMKFVSRVHESISDRRKALRGVFKDIGIKPSLIISCTDGILIAAATLNPASLKVRRVHDRVAFVGVGRKNHYGRIFDSLSSRVKLEANFYRSPGDIEIIIPRAVQEYSELIEGSFRNLYSHEYFECEIGIGFLGFNQNDDRIINIDFAGEVSTFTSQLVIPGAVYSDDQENNEERKEGDDTKPSLASAVGDKLKGEFTCRDALRIFASNLSKDVHVEVAVLKRDEARRKRFEMVYHKLSVEEVTVWLS